MCTSSIMYTLYLALVGEYLTLSLSSLISSTLLLDAASISTTSITLIPVTAMGLRAAVQTEGAAEIIAPVIIATTISTVTGIVFTLLFQNMKKWKFENVVEREIAAGRLEINEHYVGDNPIVLPEGYELKTGSEKVAF